MGWGGMFSLSFAWGRLFGAESPREEDGHFALVLISLLWLLACSTTGESLCDTVSVRIDPWAHNKLRTKAGLMSGFSTRITPRLFPSSFAEGFTLHGLASDSVVSLPLKGDVATLFVLTCWSTGRFGMADRREINPERGGVSGVGDCAEPS